MKKQTQHTTLSVHNAVIPVKIIRERRPNVRIAIGKTGATLRLPTMTSISEERKHVRWLHEWLHERLAQRATLAQRFTPKSYTDGEVLQVGERRYVLRVATEDRKSHVAKLDKETIFLRLSPLESGLDLEKSIKQLLSRVVAQDFLPEIERRVDDWNDRFFQKEISGVQLRYNQSNWGSCSRSGFIRLSTRLLFTPPEVLDYVIVHELAHLVEFNHSANFWAVVAKAIPDYKQAVKWLKAHGESCDF